MANDQGSMFKKDGQGGSSDAISKELMDKWAQMHEEYMNENEKEVPCHSSKVIHHCIHPF